MVFFVHACNYGGACVRALKRAFIYARVFPHDVRSYKTSSLSDAWRTEWGLTGVLPRSHLHHQITLHVSQCVRLLCARGATDLPGDSGAPEHDPQRGRF